MYVGIVGYVDPKKFNEKDAKEIIDRVFKDLNKDDIIVSGATNVGIPKLAYEKAKSLGMKTIGIMCEKGYDYEVFPVDELIVEGKEWGDESKEFLSSIEVLYKVGGGQQSTKEAQEAKRMGIPVYEFEL